MSIFLFPDVGEGIHEGKLISWKVKEGDTVKVDQVLCEIETDKAVVEIPSPNAGVITTLHAAAGTVILVGKPLITFADGQPSAPPQANPSAQEAANQSVVRPPLEAGTKRVEPSLVPTPPTIEQSPTIAVPLDEHNQPGPALSLAAKLQAPTGVLATPSTRKLAREKGIDIQKVRGSGPQGRVTNQDVLAALTGASQVVLNAAPIASVPEARLEPPLQPQLPDTGSVNNTVIAYDGRRKRIGEHVSQAQQVPAVTLFARADATVLVSLRERHKAAAESQGIKLTVLAFFAKATVAALSKHTIVNAMLTSRGIEVSPDIHLGFAVDNPRGLVVPVVKQAQLRSVLGLAAEISRLAELARSDKLAAADMRGSTFSITSIGAQRVEGFTPMLNTPESAILGIGAILDEPWIVAGAIVPRKIVTLSLTFDHRVFDGAEAARFMTELVRYVEDPELLLIEAA